MNLFRLIQIYFILLRFGLDDLLLKPRKLFFLRPLIYINPIHWFYARRHNRGIRTRLALIKLGPLFVKFGQVLSTRRDLLPADIADELAKLQDQVPPFPGKTAKQQIEKSLEKNIDDIFQAFDIEPIASASIAQVHGAKLKDGTDVVIKTLRPNINKHVKRDISALRSIAKLVNLLWKESYRIKPVNLVNEFAETIHAELNLLREAANAAHLKRNCENTSDVYVPTIYWDYCRRNVLVSERVHGISISNIKSLQQANINLNTLAKKCTTTFFHQAFVDNFFHADMHPGNILVCPKNPGNPTIILLDFGIMGSLSHADKRYVSANFLAVFNRDYLQFAELHVEAGWVPHNTRVDLFAAAMRAVCEPILEKPLQEVSFAQLLLELMRVTGHFKLNVQPQLILLQKTLFNVEGLARMLDPSIDIWMTAKPVLEKWVRDQRSPKTALKRICEQLPAWREKFPEIPGLVYDFLQQQTKAPQPTPVKQPSKTLYFSLGAITTIVVIVGAVLVI